MKIQPSSDTSAKSPALPYNLFLIGFMGTGKSTVAAELSRILKRPVLEMDETIEHRQGMSIPELFSLHGEAFFRKLETELLEEIRCSHGLIISCGGGVAMQKHNVEKMRESGLIVLLTAAPETICRRVSASDNRPLLKNRKTPADIAALLDTRAAAYAAAADLTIATDGKTVSEITANLLALLPKERPCHA